MFPRSLAEFIQTKGHDVVTVRRLGMRGGSDTSIWAYAEETGSVVISHDSDFVPMAAKSSKAQLVHFRGGNKSKQELIDIFDKQLPTIVAALLAGERYVEFS
jgi:predicted nuclease of predicted toxin-antitoxin system